MDEIHPPDSTQGGIQGPHHTLQLLLIACVHEGIVGRGILIYYYTWSRENNVSYDPLEKYSIPVSNLKKCIAPQNLKIQPGDILFIRSGFIKTHSTLDTLASEKQRLSIQLTLQQQKHPKKMLKWIWNEQFAAVAGMSRHSKHCVYFRVSETNRGSGYT